MKPKRNKEFKLIFPKMTKKEREKLWLLSQNGLHDGKTMFMGQVAYDKYYDFRDKMINKYINKL